MKVWTDVSKAKKKKKKTNGTDVLPEVDDHFEKDFAALSDKLVIITIRIKRMKKGSRC